jgi:hypothetical protein
MALHRVRACAPNGSHHKPLQSCGVCVIEEDWDTHNSDVPDMRPKTGTPLTFPRLSYGNPEPSSKRGNALRRQWNVQPFA